MDVVARVLVPIYHLLRAFGATTWVAFAPDRRLGRSEWRVALGSGDAAFERLVVHVGLAAPVGNPTPSASTTSRGTRGHVGWYIIHKNPFPWSVVTNGEDDKVVRGYLLDI